MTESYQTKENLYPILPSAEPLSRDPHGINKHLQLDFHNVIAEPDTSAYSYEFLHNASGQLYRYSKLFIYRLLTILVGLPLMLCWGLIIGTYTFTMIWFAVPIRRLSQSVVTEAGLYIQTVSDAIIAPIYRSIGQMFSGIRINLHNEQNNVTKTILV